MNADTPLPDSPRLTPAVRALIAISVGMVFVQLVWAPEYLADAFGFRWSRLGDRWWSVATYLFVHAGLLHVATNMVTLYVFGPRLEHEWGTGRFLRFYAACALSGLALHALFATDGVPLIGAASAVFGVMVAYAATWPTDDIFLFGVVPMRVWSVVWLLIGVNLMMGVTTSFAGGANVAYFAHIGGALAGWFYMRTPAGAGLDQLRHRVSRVPDAEEPPRAIPRTQPRPRDRVDEVDEIVARSKAIAAKRSASASRPPRVISTGGDEVDRVLDKISAEGIESLTELERRILQDRASRLKNTD